MHIRLNLYNSLFKSHLEFGILAWGAVSIKKLSGLINLQKKCVRNIAIKFKNSHTDPIFSKLKIIKVEDLLRFHSSIFMHKYILGKQPETFNNMFIPLKSNNRTGDFILQKYKLNFFDKFPSAFLPKIWNKNPTYIKNCLSESSIKLLLKESIFSNYSNDIKCNYVNCPDCI